MPRYTPIVTPMKKASLSDVIDFHWSATRKITADFIIPGNDTVLLRVEFESAEIVRLLDEMSLSTEVEVSANEGLIPDQFAYCVEDGSFWSSQSEALKISHPSLQHYRFITGWTCMDVLAQHSPNFLIIPK